MTRQTIIIALSLICHSSFGQTSNSSLSKIMSISQAEEFIDKNPKANAKIFIIQSSIDTSEITLPLYRKSNGFTFKIDNNNFKILQVDSTLSFRVSYIYLNGEQLTKAQIDSLRNEIVSKYKNGTSFIELVQTYNMDGNITGDTRWFTENMMVNEFETAVRQHKKGDIFTVDTPSQHWYHVVLKTFDDTYIKKLTILRTIPARD
ncbi:MAG: peptidylprolyl isomerase [Chitinophagaceae bacterium]